MPPPPRHVEAHFTNTASVRDVILGMADGLTVPFALAAGLSGAVAASRIVVMAGLAEIAAGSISMGLGGYLAAKSEVEHYDSERKREEREVEEVPDIEIAEVREVFRSYGLSAEESASVTASLCRRRDDWIDFMMRFELGLEKPDPKRALVSAATIGGSYVAGGLIPLLPYMFVAETRTALIVSVCVTLVALVGFGYLKGFMTGANPLRSALQTSVVGGLAAAIAFLLTRALS